MSAITTYPLNGIDYDARDAAGYNATRTSGVYSAEEDFAVTPAGGVKVTVSAGQGWVRPARFEGYSIIMREAETLTLAMADGQRPRIDRIVLRFDAASRKSSLLILQGTPDTQPTAPAISRTATVYDLCLAEVMRPASSTAITVAHIKDTRTNEALCGIMRDGVAGIPTEQLRQQWDAAQAALVADLRAQINRLTSEIDKLDDGSFYTKGETNVALEKKLDLAGGQVSGYINFDQTNKGCSWSCANGDIYHMRTYAPNSVFQLTRQNPNGVEEYGVFDVSEDGSVTIAALGSLNFTVGGATRSLLDRTYPVGSIYLSVNATSPAAKFGGTWTSIENVFLYPVPTNTAAGVQGGEASHILTVAEMPSHVHKTYMAYGGHGDGPNIPIYERSTNQCSGYATLPDTSAVGGNTAHNNMPPYMTMYAWYRVS